MVRTKRPICRPTPGTRRAALVAGVDVAAMNLSRRKAPGPRQARQGGGQPRHALGGAVRLRAGDTIYVSGQLSRDDRGKMVAPAPLETQGRIADHGNMGPQMTHAYSNIKTLLADYSATLDNVVEEVLYVTDMNTAFAIAGEVRKQAYGGRPAMVSTILVTPRLAFPDQLIEIKVIAKV